MARKVRNYRAEQLRRNELARARGFTNRYQQRHAIETGKFKALQPKRVTRPQTLKAQAEYLAKPKRQQTPTGWAYPSKEDQAQDWSTMNARTNMGQYHPGNAKRLGVTKTFYRQTYLDAFVTGDDRYKLVRHHGGSPALRYWFVDLNGFFSADEYESRYGPAA